MARLEKTDQIIELLTLFQNSYRGLTVDDIATEFECSKRSAERMLALVQKHFPLELVEQSVDRKKHWRFPKNSIKYLLNFSDKEFACLENCKEKTQNETEKKELQKIIDKLSVLNSKKVQSTDVETLLEVQGYAVRHGFREVISEEILDKIKDSILAQKQIRVDFKNSKHVIYPYGLIISDKLYVVAFNPAYNEIWTYGLGNINEVEILEDYFDKDEDFDIKKYTNESFGIFHSEPQKIELEFDKTVENIENYHFHPTQKIEQLENGNYRVKFTASGNYEIITELLKWRNCVKIIKPQNLKNEYKDTVEKMFKNL